MRDIIISADDRLIAAARRRAAREHTTLDAQIRLWLEEYAGEERQFDPEEGKKQAERAMKVIDAIRKEISASGRKFDASKLTREEMNERR